MPGPTFQRPHVVVNARSPQLRSRDRSDVLQAAVLRVLPAARWSVTAGPGDAVRLARAAVSDGADALVAIGGDGTINEVVNGMLTAPGYAAESGPALGIVPAGSGSDFARSLALPRDVAGALAIVASGRRRRIDAGRIRCAPLHPGPAPTDTERFFINMGGCGASGEVSRRFNRRRIPGALGYAAASALTTLLYRWPRVELRADGGEPRTLTLNLLFVANGEYCGGGMRAARGARLDDGLLTVVEGAGIGRLRTMLEWPRLYGGHLDKVRGIRVTVARRLEARSDEDVLVDCDGEVVGRLPAVYEIVPGAITVCA